MSCISFDSYIKPQLYSNFLCKFRVVYLLIPTSNHNFWYPPSMTGIVVYLLIPTSNHNCFHNLVFFCCCISFDSYIKPQLERSSMSCWIVVYLLIPTSNHNWLLIVIIAFMLYIFWFLHQTTTTLPRSSSPRCCISFDSYIKPQLCFALSWRSWVVYLLIPTSNHNRVLLS